MSGNPTINLATVGTAELEAMSVQVFTASLEAMSGEAIARFRRMRRLSNHHRQALEQYLIEHPEKRSPDDEELAAATARPTKAAKAAKPAMPAKPAKPAKVAGAKTAKQSLLPKLKLRLRAWWEGVEVEDLPLLDAARARGGKNGSGSQRIRREAKPGAEAAASEATAEADVPQPELVDINQMLWGEGFNLPGGADFTLGLVRNVNFPAGRPCLDVSPGLGGGMRAIALTRKVTVEGIERDPLFAAAGAHASDHLGMSEEAPIRFGDPEAERLPEGRYAAIIAREALYCFADRKAFLVSASRALADGGSLVLTDFVLADRLHKDETLANWRAAEPRKPAPATREDYAELLQELRYEIKVCDDLTASYVPLIQAGWRQLLAHLESAQLSPERAGMLMKEGNLWLARSRALESGRLKLLHIHALMRRAPKRALSDSMTIE